MVCKWFTFSGISLWIIIVLFLLFGSNDPWDNCHHEVNTLYSNYGSAIKTLDSGSAYFVHEMEILDSVVEPPLEYDYTARPYQLKPLLLREMPEVHYFGADGQEIPESESTVDNTVRSEYTLRLQPGIYYCLEGLPYPKGFKLELQAEDFRIAIIRLADPKVGCPVYSQFKSFLPGLEECSQFLEVQNVILDNFLFMSQLEREYYKRPEIEKNNNRCIDYSWLELECFQKIDDYSFKLILNRKYPQFLYWLATNFFAPVPRIAYGMDGYASKVDFDMTFHPVGTGDFYVKTSDPRHQIILERSPYSRHKIPNGLDRVVFQYERENLPCWLKFLQGYYDRSRIPGEMFEAAVDMNPGGDLELNDELSKLQLQQFEGYSPISYYFGFNMRNPIVGGLTDDKRALRQAISIVLDYREYLDIFQNGRGNPAQGIIPPGIFGFEDGEEGVNPYTDEWDDKYQRPRRRSLERAKTLMIKAGYPEGRDKNGMPLELYLDHAASGIPGFKAEFLWLRQRFQLLGIELRERPSDLNRWREKMDSGNWQLIFNKGWVADYPDPENFLFLFNSANGKVSSGGRGANYVNYSSSEYDQVFRQLETLENGPERLELIRLANRILQRDAPCCWGYNPAKLVLVHHWLHGYVINDMACNTLKYLSVDNAERLRCQKEWNKMRLSGLMLVASIFLAMGIIFCISSGKAKRQRT